MTSLEHMGDFALSLRRESNTEGSVYSPISIGLVLNLLHAGANGATKTQIAQALAKENYGESNAMDACEPRKIARSESSDKSDESHNFPIFSGGPTDEDLRRLLLKSKEPPSYFAGDLTPIGPVPSSSSDPAKVDVLVATRLYVRAGLSIEPDYLAVIKKNYDAVAKIVNFTNANEAAATINTFVKETTQDKIQEIVEANFFEKDTAAVVVNAICFNAKWAKKFNKESTRTAEFSSGGGTMREIQMMYQTASFMYTERPEVQVLSMKYVDGSYAYDVFLPKEDFAGGLDAFLAGLTGAKIQTLIKSMKPEDVKVALPKSRIVSNLSLKETLINLGINDLFNPSAADLSGIINEKTKPSGSSNDKSKPSLYVTRVVHKAIIEVDEEGTTAAAASTGIVYADSPKFTKFFQANRPYFFMLSRGGAPLMMGVYR